MPIPRMGHMYMHKHMYHVSCTSYMLTVPNYHYITVSSL